MSLDIHLTSKIDVGGLVSCVEDYLEACKKYPKSDIEVSR